MPQKPEPRCPKCRETLLQERLLSDDRTRMDVCPQCRGGWFDRSELDDVLSCAVDTLDLPDEPERTSCVCPRCFVPLAVVDYPETSVEVDVCEQCHGVWLDRGEFRAINVQRGIPEPAQVPRAGKAENTASCRGSVRRSHSREVRGRAPEVGTIKPVPGSCRFPCG